VTDSVPLDGQLAVQQLDVLRRVDGLAAGFAAG